MSSSEKDYKETLFLPTTTFPMRANLPEREKEWLDNWEELKIYKKLRQDSSNRKILFFMMAPLMQMETCILGMR